MTVTGGQFYTYTYWQEVQTGTQQVQTGTTTEQGEVQDTYDCTSYGDVIVYATNGSPISLACSPGAKIFYDAGIGYFTIPVYTTEPVYTNEQFTGTAWSPATITTS